ncbi:hypothetical protein KA478_03885 [Patescibacteria group bacterium]|nr:hypothetical protein [Patescibacteria group bacterium]
MFYIKFTFLIIGSVGTMAAILSGEAAAEGINSKLIHTHEEFAEMTRNLFVVLSLIYLAKLYVREKQTSLAHALPPFLQNILAWIAKYADKIFAPQVLAVVGLFLVTITGALGGAITYGRDADPIVKRSVSTFVK